MLRLLLKGPLIKSGPLDEVKVTWLRALPASANPSDIQRDIIVRGISRHSHRPRAHSRGQDYAGHGAPGVGDRGVTLKLCLPHTVCKCQRQPFLIAYLAISGVSPDAWNRYNMTHFSFQICITHLISTLSVFIINIGSKTKITPNLWKGIKLLLFLTYYWGLTCCQANTPELSLILCEPARRCSSDKLILLEWADSCLI